MRYAVLCALLLSACAPASLVVKPGEGRDSIGGQDTWDTGAASAALFDGAVLHELTVTLPAADWTALRRQARTYYDILGEGCMEGPFESPYTWFTGEAVFDGEPLGAVGVRKKGLIGSVTPDRPSLKIDVNRVQEGATFHGLTKLVFNNNNQDGSRMRSCLAHGLFADAGLVAPRCSLTHVVVNGEDLGVYSHVESIDADLVARQRGAAPAAMYEGTLSDFRQGWMATFEPETDGADGREIAAVTEALTAPDGELLTRLDAVLDLDAFFTFWAAESLAGHWDGYNGNTNNFFVYTDPADGRLEFIAGGPDAAFDGRTPFGREAPVWVAATSALANRLIRHDEARARYTAEMERLLDDVWQEDARLAQVDAWTELVEPWAGRWELGAIRDTREIVAAKEGDIRSVGADVPLGAAWTPPDLRGAFCWEEIGSVRIDFSTTWGSYPRGDLFTGGEAVSSYDIEGQSYPATAEGVSAGDAGDGRAIWLSISTIAPDTFLGAYVVFDLDRLAPGAIQIDGEYAEGYLIYQDPSTNGEWVTAAYLGSTGGDATLTFTAAGGQQGNVLEGVLEAAVLGSPGG